MPVRILQIGIHDNIGGVEKFVMNYYENINREKIQFDFVSQYEKLCFEDEIKKMGGHIYSVDNVGRHPIKYYHQLKKIIHNGGYKTVHINMLSAANVLPIFAAKSCHVKNIIIHSHNSNIPPGILRKILHIINKPFLHMGNEYWACSLAAGDWMFGKKFFEKSKHCIIKNALDLNEFKFNAEKRELIRRRLQISKNTKVFGHIGRFSYQKNHEYLLDVFYRYKNKYNDSILILIGSGELMDIMRRKVHDLGIDDSVIFVGNVSNVQDYLSAMDIFLLPSKFEGLPVVGVEAQANGLPCIFSSNISSEVDISGRSSFLGVEDIHIDEWVECMSKKIRQNRDLGLVDKDYDIKEQSGILENMYMDMNRYIVFEFLYDLGYGGVETFLKNYKIKNKNFLVYIFTNKISSDAVKHDFESYGYIVNATKRDKGMIRYLIYMNTVMKKMSPDIIHAHMTFGNFLPCMIAWKHGVKIRISHSHFAFTKISIKNSIYRFIGNIFANKFVACTSEAAKCLFGRKHTRAIVIKNAIDVNKYRFNGNIRNAIRKKLNINKSTVVYGNIGRFTEQKNHVFLLRVFKELTLLKKDVKLLIIGSGEIKYIEEIIKHFNIDRNNIIILEDRRDINELLMAMDCFVFPSLFEGLGIALVEAQASGLYCLSSDKVPNDAKIINKNVLSLSLKNTNEWVKALSCISVGYDRTVDKNFFSRNGYDIESSRNSLEQYYMQLLGEI